MTRNCKWLFQGSPALLLVLDESLICRDMTSVWRQQLALPESGGADIPAAELFDFENNPELSDQFNAVLENGEKLAEELSPGHFSILSDSYDPDSGEITLTTPLLDHFGDQWQSRSDAAELRKTCFGTQDIE